MACQPQESRTDLASGRPESAEKAVLSADVYGSMMDHAYDSDQSTRIMSGVMILLQTERVMENR